MAGYGKGMLDPDSDYYQRLSQGMAQRIGAQSAAQQRAAAMRGAWGGFGAGASPERLQTQADLGQAGMEATGQAEAGLRLAAPQIGAQMLQSTFNPQLGYNQLTEGSRQWAGSLGEQSRQFGYGQQAQQNQFGANLALQQQQMANQMAQAQAGYSQQANMFNAQMQADQQRMQWEAMMNQMAGLYG
jgi:hypothetical protein